jgi:hypothetical protein
VGSCNKMSELKGRHGLARVFLSQNRFWDL